MKKPPGTSRRNGLSLSDQAYAEIKERIITLFFAPGQYLNEGSICGLLGVGRTPVHQALQRLQLEGLVEIVPRKGVVIQPDSMGQVLAILDARLVVEPALAERAAANAADRDIEELETILGNHSVGHHGGGEIAAFVECDGAFHKKISDMSGSTILADFAKTLHERSTRAWYLHLWRTLDTRTSSMRHRAVLEAIKARDPASATQAMHAHLEELRQRVLHLHQNSPKRRAGAPQSGLSTRA